MPTYQQRGNAWRAMIRLKGFPAIARTFDDKATAMAWADKREADMRAGRWTPPAPTPQPGGKDLAWLATLYREESEKHVRPETWRNVDYFVRALPKRAPWLWSKSITDITSQDIAQYRDERLKTVSAATVLQEVKRLSAIFQFAVNERELLEKNPVLAVRKPPSAPSRDRRLSPDEEARLIAQARKIGKNWLADLITFAIETGMRRGEIVKLRAEHVLWERSALSIPPKNDKLGRGRMIPLSASALAVLRAHFVEGDPVIWRTDHQKLVTAPLVDIFFQRIKHTLGIEDLHFHDLRHEALSRFSERGLNPIQTAAISGHSSLQMLKRYTHLQPEDLADLIAQPRKARAVAPVEAPRPATAPRPSKVRASAPSVTPDAAIPADVDQDLPMPAHESDQLESQLRQMAARIAQRKKMEAIAAEFGITVEELEAEALRQG